MGWRLWLVSLGLMVGLNAVANADTIHWPTHATELGPGGVATITLEPRHGQTVKGPDTVITIRSDNPQAVVHVLLDGKVIASDGTPMETTDLHEVVPIEFSQALVIRLPVRGLARGIHSLEIKEEGTRGTSLPRVNEQRIDFLVQYRQQNPRSHQR